MQEKQILDRISKAEQRIVDLYRRLTGTGTGTATLPYKSYVAIISQSGGTEPTEDTLLENTIGAPVTYQYISTGEFNIKITDNKFTSGKTVIMVSPGRRTTANTFLGTTMSGTETIVLYSYSPAGISTNGLISQVTVEIRVYN